MRPFPFVLLGAALVAGVAHADPASDAKDLFERARLLRAAGNCAEAAPLFEKAATIYPAGLGNVRNAAECEEQLGHYATAHRLWNDLKRGAMISTDSRYRDWQADAEAAAARLLPKLAHVTIAIGVNDGKAENPLAPGSHVAVTINGEPMPIELVGTVLDRDPGKYVITVTGEGGQTPSSQTVELTTGDTKTLHFTVLAPPKKVVPKDPEHPVPPPSNGAATRRTIGWVGVGVGAAALVGAGISLGVRQAALGDLKTACPKYETAACPDSVQSTVSRGSTASVLVNVLGIAGGVLAVGGILLVVLSPSPKAEAPATAFVPRVSVGFGSVAAEWSFQ